jgi:thymidylate synthase (FAD)
MREIPVLDKGFVRLIESMGGDAGVLQAARVSFAGTSKGEVQDKRLIEYLLKHQHLTPFEHALLKFHVKCPIFVARQWFRHRFGAYNEISFRYTVPSEDFYTPESFRAQDQKNKQGSIAAPTLDQEALRRSFAASVDLAFKTYHGMVDAGVAREMARMVLPVNVYTEFFWTVNARSLMNFLWLRADAHAQLEIQRYAEALSGCFAETCPWTYAAFLSHLWTGKNPKLDAEKERLCPSPASS